MGLIPQLKNSKKFMSHPNADYDMMSTMMLDRRHPSTSPFHMDFPHHHHVILQLKNRKYLGTIDTQPLCCCNCDIEITRFKGHMPY